MVLPGEIASPSIHYQCIILLIELWQRLKSLLGRNRTGLNNFRRVATFQWPTRRELDSVRGFKPPVSWSVVKCFIRIKLHGEIFILERAPGYDPGTIAWKAIVLPIKLCPHFLIFIFVCFFQNHGFTSHRTGFGFLIIITLGSITLAFITNMI